MREGEMTRGSGEKAKGGKEDKPAAGPTADGGVNRREDPAIEIGSAEEDGKAEGKIDSATVADGEATRGGYG